MKKCFYALVMVSGLMILTAFRTDTTSMSEHTFCLTSTFCEGWKDGYCEGWKDVKGQYSICPITPLCPLPEIGQNHYKGGYNRGFKAGANAADNY